MKFTLVKDVKKDRLLKPLLSGLLLFMLLFITADYLSSRTLLGTDIRTLSATLYGNEEEFIEPLPSETLLESVHMNTFFLMMASITLCAVFTRLNKSVLPSRMTVHIVMFSALLELCALLGAYYISPICLAFYLLGFYVWHIAALFIALLSLWMLYSR